MYGSTVHCKDCSTAITLASWQQPAQFCPYCASSNLVSDTDQHRTLLAQRLTRLVNQWANGYVATVHNPRYSPEEHRSRTAQGKTYNVPKTIKKLQPQLDPTKWTYRHEITLSAYDALLQSYRTQNAFPTFSEYVICMMTNKPGWSKQEREQQEQLELARLH